jgi:hypothetical protein
MREQLAGMGGEGLEEVPFHPGEVDVAAVPHHAMRVEVDRDAAGLEHLRPVLRRVRPAQQRPDPRQELVHAERLGQVVEGLHGDDLEAIEDRHGLRRAVGGDEPDHHVGPAFEPPLALREHRVRLADPWCRT